MSKNTQEWMIAGFIVTAVAVVAAVTFITISTSKQVPSSPPAMPESKSEAMVKSEPELKSPVLDKARERRFNAFQMMKLNDTLQQEGIRVTIGDADDAVLIDFIYALLNDEESQKVFRQFSKEGVLIYLTAEYKIGDEFVYVDITKGVKKVAQWLATGKN